MESHYLPSYCQHNGPKVRAACGRWVRDDQHSAEPTCADCTAWLVADVAEAERLTALYGERVEDQADALFGTPDHAAPITLNTFSSTDGYRVKGAR